MIQRVKDGALIFGVIAAAVLFNYAMSKGWVLP